MQNSLRCLLLLDFNKNGLGKLQTENFEENWHKKLENLLNINSLLILSSPKSRQWGHFYKEKTD